jgi:UPF0716 protein FxsA
MYLIVLFIGLPLLEFNLLMAVAENIGGLPTFGLIVLTGVAGASLARSQGVAIWAKIQAEMASGREPTASMLEGVLILVAGLVLLTPGFLTDIVGLLCLAPVTRRPLLAWLRRRLKAGMSSGRVHVRMGGMPTGPRPGGRASMGGRPGGGPTIKDADVIDDGAGHSND